MSIYVASSWRNRHQPVVVTALRAAGHEVYDFRHPAPGNEGFSWSDIDPEWRQWSPQAYREALTHPIARAGFKLDFDAMKAADTCVLVLPSGRSASWEFGWCCGQGKRGVVYMPEPCEPELMYLGNEIVPTLEELVEVLRGGVDAFHAHLDACERCRTRPFDLCAVGAPLLARAGAAA